MKEDLILPIACNTSQEFTCKSDAELSLKVSEWLDRHAEFILQVWSQPSAKQKIDFSCRANGVADEITKMLTNRIFNYQSNRNLTEIISKVRQILVSQISNGEPLEFFLLYNGGYRASSVLSQPTLIFEPDQTEMMLLYQIAILYKKIISLYDHGFEFSIVVNNGVAKWVNDIPISDTEHYADQLRKMISFFGAENSVRVLLQSELAGFNPGFSFQSVQSQPLLSKDEHQIVERFLGRSCSQEEAEYRFSLYKLAESNWAEDLLPIIATNNGIIMRQVAHPDMLSFRPFPGGAIRIQNGTFGFQYQKNVLMPKLITSKSIIEHDVQCVSYHLPWEKGRSNKN